MNTSHNDPNVQTKAKSFLQDLQQLCAKHAVSISGVGYAGGVQVDGAFQMMGLAASSEAASGQLGGELIAPYLTSKFINNEEVMVLQPGALKSQIGTFIGVRKDGTSQIVESLSNEDLIVKSCRVSDAFTKAFSNFKKAVYDEVTSFERQMIEHQMVKATQNYLDFVGMKVV